MVSVVPVRQNSSVRSSTSTAQPNSLARVCAGPPSPAADVEHPHPGCDAGEACELQRRPSAAGVELVHWGEVFYGEGVRVFPGGAQRFEDPRCEVAATVVGAYGAVIVILAHALPFSRRGSNVHSF